MAVRTIARLYDDRNTALGVVDELDAAGFPHSDISVILNNSDKSYTTSPSGSGAGTGAAIGGVVGGGAGLLAGLGAIAIPGVGPIVAAGWLIATLAGAGVGAGVGAAAGGLVGSLTEAGVSPDEANVYTEGVRRGGTLVTLRAEEVRIAEAEAIMARHPAVDWRQRGELYRSSGWTRFDPAAPAYTTAEIELERQRLRDSRI